MENYFGNKMKAIILAAGKGTRLSKYTDALPKGMLEFGDMTLIARQIETFQNEGISDIAIITGYQADKITYEGVSYYHNPNYDTTNMVESLFCAEDFLAGHVIVSYSDIIFESKVVNALKQAKGDVVVTVDKNWQDYWEARYDRVDFDLESLKLDEANRIVELGSEDCALEEIDGRYVGLIKFSLTGTDALKKIYHEEKARAWDKPWQISGRTFQQAFMTDMLQEFIDRKMPIDCCIVDQGWLEFDTNEDYERMQARVEQDTLDELFNLRG